MKKFTITHYQKSNSMFMVNGGRLLITDDKYMVKYLFHKVSEFEKGKTIVNKIPGYWFHNGIRLDDGDKQIELFFFPKTAQKVYKILTEQ